MIEANIFLTCEHRILNSEKYLPEPCIFHTMILK